MAVCYGREFIGKITTFPDLQSGVLKSSDLGMASLKVTPDVQVSTCFALHDLIVCTYRIRVISPQCDRRRP